MKPWLREDTRDWLAQVEHRIEDIDYYLNRTLDWCENNGVYRDEQVFMCSFLTCVWVCSMRNEQVSYNELLEILGLETHSILEADRLYDLGPMFENLDHEEMLNLAVKNFQKF
jgi:hypothetical protein